MAYSQDNNPTNTSAHYSVGVIYSYLCHDKLVGKITKISCNMLR